MEEMDGRLDYKQFVGLPLDIPQPAYIAGFTLLFLPSLVCAEE